MDLTLLVQADGPANAPTVVVAAGAINADTAPRLREQLIDLLDSGRHHLILDLDGVRCLDPTGLGVLVGAVRRLHPHSGSLRLVCTRPRIVKVILGVGLGKVLLIHSSQAEAVAATSAPRPVTETAT